ncbi:MAG: MMPL family transporter, partial [Gammaproteobacteria bacterium]
MTRIGRISSAWSALVQRTAPWIVVVTIAVSVPVLEFAATHLGVYTDTAAMLSDKLPFRQSYERYRRAFPQLTDMILAVIDADTPESADAAGRELAAELEPAGAIFADVFLAGADPFFARNALLYLDEAELDEVGRRLIAAQPLIGQLNGNRTLEGLAEMLRHAVERPPGGPDPGLENLAIELDRSLTALRAESPYTVSWLNALGLDPNGGGATRRYLFLKPILDFREPLAAGAAMRAIRDATDRLDLSGRFGARVRLTGDAALSHDELTTAMRGAQLAGVLALTMVTVVLTVGLRSAWLVIASLVNLLVGLLLTAGFAAAAVGNLNLISLAFAVLYIGLGVDYAIHLSLRYDELLQQGETKRDALRRAAGDVGPSLFLCTLTTATGFFAFWPT